jgi:hypothetical protein
VGGVVERDEHVRLLGVATARRGHARDEDEADG